MTGRLTVPRSCNTRRRASCAADLFVHPSGPRNSSWAWRNRYRRLVAIALPTAVFAVLGAAYSLNRLALPSARRCGRYASLFANRGHAPDVPEGEFSC